MSELEEMLDIIACEPCIAKKGEGLNQGHELHKSHTLDWNPGPGLGLCLLLCYSSGNCSEQLLGGPWPCAPITMHQPRMEDLTVGGLG